MVDPLLLCNGYQMGGLWCILCSHRVEPVIVLFRMHCAIDCASLMHCGCTSSAMRWIVVWWIVVDRSAAGDHGDHHTTIPRIAELVHSQCITVAHDPH